MQQAPGGVSLGGGTVDTPLPPGGREGGPLDTHLDCRSLHSPPRVQQTPLEGETGQNGLDLVPSDTRPRPRHDSHPRAQTTRTQ